MQRASVRYGSKDSAGPRRDPTFALAQNRYWVLYMLKNMAEYD